MDATFASVGEGRAAAASGGGAAARPLVLVTNDDGYSAMGIKTIVAQLEEFAGQGGMGARSNGLQIGLHCAVANATTLTAVSAVVDVRDCVDEGMI